jgi:hypothetical protein
MITMISWNAGEISAFMIVKIIDKVAIVTTLPILSLRRVIKWSPFINIKGAKMERYCCNFKKTFR